MIRIAPVLTREQAIDAAVRKAIRPDLLHPLALCVDGDELRDGLISTEVGAIRAEFARLMAAA